MWGLRVMICQNGSVSIILTIRDSQEERGIGVFVILKSTILKKRHNRGNWQLKRGRAVNISKR